MILLTFILSLDSGYLCYPLVHVLQSFQISDIVNEEYGVGVVYVCVEHLAGNGRSVNVPQLQRNIDVAHQLEALLEKVNSNGFLVILIEIVFAIACDYLRLADSWVAHYYYLIRQILRLVLLLTTRVLRFLIVFVIHF